jgi:hypothetical protein
MIGARVMTSRVRPLPAVIADTWEEPPAEQEEDELEEVSTALGTDGRARMTMR